jgi:mercuric ion transport protein
MKPSKVAVTASGSMLSALLSFLPLTCCVFPLAFSFLGAGGLALAMDMMQYRPHFIALTLAFLAAGFYFAYRPEQIGCAPGAACRTPKSRRLQRVSLWVVTILTLALIAFPYLIPYLPIGS